VNTDFPENDPMWQLLTKATSPVKNPFFARNVLRRIRQAEPTPFLPISLLRWLRSGAIACLAVAFISSLVTSHESLSVTEQAMFDNAANISELSHSQEFTLLALVQDSQEPFLIY
jgi:hypothetical protein